MEICDFLKFRKNKKGSHVGVILSFGIFVTFMVFLYVALEPALQTQEEQKILIDKLKPSIKDRISANFTTMTISNSSATGCIVINNYEYADMNSTLVKDPEGNIVGSNVSGGHLYIDADGDDFYKIYSSDVSLNSQGFSPSGCSGFEKGIQRKSREVSEEKALDLIDYYNSNYSLLKDELGVLDENNFGFDFIYDNGTAVETETTNLTRDVFIEKFPTQYFNDDATRKGGFFRIKIW